MGGSEKRHFWCRDENADLEVVSAMTTTGRSKIFWVNLWQLYYSDSTVFKFCTSMWLFSALAPALYKGLGLLAARKIIKIVATRCQILRLKCTKFDFGWGSAPDLAGGAYSAPPKPLGGFKGAYF